MKNYRWTTGTRTTRSSLVEVIDWTSKFIFLWNSSARQIKGQITENRKNLEQVFNMIFLSEASKK